MLFYLIILFVTVPAIELALLIKIGQVIGLFYTIMIVIFTGITGAYLAKIQGALTISKIRDDINLGRMPADRLIDGLLILVSGILLLTPGFLTDFTGFIGLIPVTRNLLREWIKSVISDMIKNGKVVRIKPFNFQ
ncbi:MAG: FxsA family protein [Candidatus Omnitrophica bacterium]|nr:FxsA family protein [Candidatus Omnitrophota bacterium]